MNDSRIRPERLCVLIVTAALACTANTSSAQMFDGFQNATSDGTTTTFQLRITGGAANQIVQVCWEQPPGTPRIPISLQLEADGTKATNSLVPVGAQLGADSLKLKNAAGTAVLDTCEATWVGGSFVRVPTECDPCDLLALVAPVLPGAPALPTTHPCFGVPVSDPPTDGCCIQLDLLLPLLPGAPSLSSTHPCFVPPCVPVDPVDCICPAVFDPVTCDQGDFSNQCFADCECATNCVPA